MRDHPLSTLSRKVLQYRPLDRRKLPLVALAYLKFVFFEPVRQFDRLFNKNAIEDLPQDPIFIIGHWRSGTSLLQYLLCQDERFGYAKKSDMLFPELIGHQATWFRELLERVTSFWQAVGDFKAISVDWNWDDPGELDIAMNIAGEPATPHWGHLFPRRRQRYFDKYLYLEDITDEEFARWKRMYQRYISKLSRRYRGRRLVIKSPNNTCRIQELLELYPRASFVYIHRNPYDVYYSNKKLWNVILKHVSFQRMETRPIQNMILSTYTRVLEKYRIQREHIPEGQLFELQYEDLVHTPLEKMEELYAMLSLAGFGKVRSRLLAFVEENSVAPRSSYQYEPSVLEAIDRELECIGEIVPVDSEVY